MGPVIASIVIAAIVVAVVIWRSDGEGAFFLSDELSTRPSSPSVPCEYCPWAG